MKWKYDGNSCFFSGYFWTIWCFFESVYIPIQRNIFAVVGIYIAKTEIEINDKLYYTDHAVQFLIIFMLFVVIYLLDQVDLNISRTSPPETNPVDEKLFDLWCKSNCCSFKKEPFAKETQPTRMYEILAEKINEYEINIDETYEIDEKSICNNLMVNVISKRINNKTNEKNEIPDNIIKRMKMNGDLEKRLNRNRKNDSS